MAVSTADRGHTWYFRINSPQCSSRPQLLQLLLDLNVQIILWPKFPRFVCELCDEHSPLGSRGLFKILPLVGEA